MAAAAINTGGVTKPQLIEIGRPNGPDLQLKFDDDALTLQAAAGATGDIIKSDSSITEVLNVISFLTNQTRSVAAMVETKARTCVPGVGATDAGTGYYPDDNAAPIANDFPARLCELSLAEPADPTALIKIPVSILKRRVPAAAGADPAAPPTFNDMGTKQITANAAGKAAVTGLLSDCVKQMIVILQQTRDILGPRGWTDLFQKVTGGSSANKKAKRTHRHRRRYSSKQY
jgi:hypothetical protein